LEWQDFARGALDLFFPANCSICGLPLESLNRSFICWNCWQKVEWVPFPVCIRCGKPLGVDCQGENFSPICSSCQKFPPGFKRLFTPTFYRGVMAEAIRLFKYKSMRGISRGFNFILDSYFKKVDFISLGIELVVPVPLHPKRKRERGFNQAEDIARIVARHLKVKVGNYLARVRYTLPQTNLDKQDRRKNLTDAFVLRKKIEGKTVLLVDDVYTTGATLNEASSTIKQAKAEVFAFALARTPD